MSTANTPFGDSMFQTLDAEEFDDAGNESDDPVDPSFIENSDDSPDPYVVLGVSRTATAADIRAAYKRLSLLFHPDRHTTNDSVDPGNNAFNTQVAEATFGRISSAYAILSDPNKRTIYDIYGHEGLKIQGWELATCEKSAAELRLEYLMLKQKAETEKQLQLTQPTSEFALGFDLTELFDIYMQQLPDDRLGFPWPSVNQLYLAQSVTAGLTLTDSVSLAGQVTAHNGLGVGTGMILWRHHCNKHSLLHSTTIDTELSYGRSGRGLDFGLRFKRPFGNRFTGSLGLSLTALFSRFGGSSLSIIPGFSTGMTIQLLPRTLARVEWRANMNPGLSSEIMWASVDEKYVARLSTRLSPTGRAGVALRLERTVSWLWLTPIRSSSAHHTEPPSRSNPDWTSNTDELETQQSTQSRLFGSVDVNTSDLAEFTLGAQFSVSVYSRLSGSLSFSVLRGVSLKLGLHRGTQTYSIPITLSEEPNLIAAAYGLIVPVLTLAAVRSLLYEPYMKRQLEHAQSVRRAKLKSELKRRRTEALAVQALMQTSASRVKQAETSVQGLIIVRAIYGFLPLNTTSESSSDSGGPLTIDVTIPIQALVERSHLRLPPGRWSDMQGFYDPCMGIQVPPSKAENLRQLRVIYQFRGVSHEVTVAEEQGLAIPMTKHRIEAL